MKLSQGTTPKRYKAPPNKATWEDEMEWFISLHGPVCSKVISLTYGRPLATIIAELFRQGRVTRTGKPREYIYTTIQQERVNPVIRKLYPLTWGKCRDSVYRFLYDSPTPLTSKQIVDKLKYAAVSQQLSKLMKAGLVKRTFLHCVDIHTKFLYYIEDVHGNVPFNQSAAAIL